MTSPKLFPVHAGWQLILVDLGLRPADVLRRAALPGDLFTREESLTTAEYFRLWRAIEDESADPTLSIRIAESLRAEAFDPPIFAALCSPDLNTALRRLSHYKRLVCPMALHVSERADSTHLAVEWLDPSEPAPASLVGMELTFFVQLARMATRTRVRPTQVISPIPLKPVDSFRKFFGTDVQQGRRPELLFDAADARRPFLTANEKMWEFFEPELRKRLSALDEAATVEARVRGVLLELLPSGAASVDAVARKLNLSARTLQRRLSADGSSFQTVLNRTREELARHYLKSSSMSSAEISFLLGYEDPNSFFRAFHAWTGDTPEKMRAALNAEP